MNDPLGIIKKPQTRVAETASKTVEVARNELNDVENCVVCGTRMKILSCAGIPAHVCIAHRIAVPTKD